jgi:hypothetical protein
MVFGDICIIIGSEHLAVLQKEISSPRAPPHLVGGDPAPEKSIGRKSRTLVTAGKKRDGMLPKMWSNLEEHPSEMIWMNLFSQGQHVLSMSNKDVGSRNWTILSPPAVTM